MEMEIVLLVTTVRTSITVKFAIIPMDARCAILATIWLMPLTARTFVGMEFGCRSSSAMTITQSMETAVALPA